MGTSRCAIERAWATDAMFAVTLTGSLVGSGWKAFNQFALPRFLSESLQYLEQRKQGMTMANFLFAFRFCVFWLNLQRTDL